MPPDHPQSNYGAARDSLLQYVPLPLENIHRIRPEAGGAAAAAEEYAATIRRYFSLPARAFPRFDLVFLGLGSDGHTASLFPGSPALNDRSHLAVAPRVERLNAYRITLTVPVFQNASCLLYLVVGEDKAEAVGRSVYNQSATGVPAEGAQAAGGLFAGPETGAARVASTPAGQRATRSERG